MNLAPIGSQKSLWPRRRKCHSLHSNYMLNPGLRLRPIHQQQIPSTSPALPLGKPLPPLNFTSLATKLNNGEVTLNGVTATGSESVTLGQTLVWNRPSVCMAGQEGRMPQNGPGDPTSGRRCGLGGSARNRSRNRRLLMREPRKKYAIPPRRRRRSGLRSMCPPAGWLPPQRKAAGGPKKR